MRNFAAVCLLGCVILMTGCADAEPEVLAVAAPVNTLCPIMGHEVTDDGGRVDFDGQTVGFCCPGCIDQWNALSAEEKAASLASPPAHDDEPAGDHGGHDHAPADADADAGAEPAAEPAADESTES